MGGPRFEQFLQSQIRSGSSVSQEKDGVHAAQIADTNVLIMNDSS